MQGRVLKGIILQVSLLLLPVSSVAAHDGGNAIEIKNVEGVHWLDELLAHTKQVSSFVEQFCLVKCTRSVAVLAVRGRDYPLELSATAWIDPQTGMIAKISAGVDRAVEDIGRRAMHAAVDFAPVRFGGTESAYWFPSHAGVEVETPHQHWRNTHRSSDSMRFSVRTEEQLAKQ